MVILSQTHNLSLRKQCPIQVHFVRYMIRIHVKAAEIIKNQENLRHSPRQEETKIILGNVRIPGWIPQKGAIW